MNERYPLPEGWRWVRLGEVFALTSGKSRPNDIKGQADSSYIFPVYGGNGILGFAREYFIEVPTLVLGRVGEYCGSVHISKAKSWVSDNALFIKQMLRNDVDINYLSFALSYLDLNKLKKQTGQPLINQEIVCTQFIPLPPLAEQKRITTKLQELTQEVKCALTACEKQLEAAKALPAAYLREVFESEEAKRWERKRLGEVCEFSSGKFIQKEKVKSQGAYPVYGANGIIGFTDERIFDKEVIIIGRVGSCGMVNKSVGPAWITDNTIVLQPLNQVTFDFLYWKLKSLKLEELRAAAVQPLITQKDLKPLLILLPPLPTQQRIAQDLKEKMVQVENLQTSARNQQSALVALPQAILRKAFRGEL